MNKIAHAVILGFFALACWFLWGLLHISGAVPLDGHPLPAYTRLCLGLGPSLLTALVVAAALYCVWVWFRKADARASWVAFLSTTTAVLSFTMLLVFVAAYLPLMSALNQLAHK
jgi:hypothetical protein